MYSLLILPDAIFIEEQLLSEYETKPTITRSPRYNQRNEITRSPRYNQRNEITRSPRYNQRNEITRLCDHVKNFSCVHSEQTVFLNGKKQHTKKNLCKCYDCGMEFSN
jgi:hypothetical protein